MNSLDLNSDRHTTIHDLKRLKSQLIDQKSALEARMTELQAEAKRNFFLGRDIGTEEGVKGYGVVHLAVVMLLGAWIGMWIRGNR